MSALAELEAREAACMDEIGRLAKRLEDLYEGREGVSALSCRFQEEMQRRYQVASSAASLSGLRRGQNPDGHPNLPTPEDAISSRIREGGSDGNQ